jgi:hypothetical protein
MNREQRRAVAGARPVAERDTGPMPACMLAWRVVQAVYAERFHDRPSSCGPMLRPLLLAQRSVLTDRVAKLAEEMRTEHIGVTVQTFEKARFPEGWTWWEWDPRIEERLPPASGEMARDRVGALIETDASCQRGTMHFVFSAPVEGRGIVVEPTPFACAFDWREDYEPPPSLLRPATADDYRRMMARVPLDATLGELEGSPEFFASVSRRCGLVENRFFKAAADLSGVIDEVMRDEELFANISQEIVDEMAFMLAVSIVVLSVPLAATLVARGAKLPESAGVTSEAPFSFVVLDLAPGVFPQDVA